jgi:FMN phosphatase YigB (HAD superfamily)
MFKKNKNLLFNLLFILLFFSQSCYSINIIFDLGGVLINTDRTYMMKKIGFYSFFMYMLKLNNPFDIQTRLFETLTHIPASTKNTSGATDDKGKILPDIMCDWLSGQKKSTEIKTLALNYIEDNKKEFCNYGEKQLISKIVELMFTPQNLINSIIISQEGLKFVKKCKESGHKIFILSNWDYESSFIVKEQYPELFDLFDQENIVFSGQIGLIKPDPKIYECIVKKNNLDPRQCIFFDDQEINVESAKNSGIHAVVCKNAKCSTMIKELNSFIHSVANIPANQNNPISTENLTDVAN